MDYDVIVVGAGPAGSVAAHNLSRAGLSVLQLEKYRLPRSKPCGGAVMYRGIKIVQGDIPRSIIEQRIHGMRFIMPNGKEAEFTSDKLMGITVDRSSFDEHLARRAEKVGTTLIDNTRVLKAEVSDTNAKVTTEGGREFTSRFIIGADGVNSIVSRSLGLRPLRKDLTKVGLGMESDFYVGEDGVLQATRGNPSILEIAPVVGRIGYGWVFPKRESLGIGVAGAGYHMTHLRQIFDTFWRSVSQRTGVPLTLKRRRAHFLGGDGLHSQNVAKRAILVGDAAGFVDPTMGEGIAYAMQSAAFAADVIIRAYESGAFDVVTLSEYQELCRQEFAANFAMVGWAGTNSTLLSTLLTRISGHQLAGDIMAMTARGEIGYADIPRYTLRALPRHLPRILRRVVLCHLGAPC
ncbi:MAG: NAD(P)/FAD-dependent oxidoreductase [Candidatus Thorarchaeota archaeon]|nr:MAG: hypothetical protein DRP09_08210 [Candidatus Thorarchaeota archaeon]